MTTIRPMVEQDITSVSIVHSEAFKRQLSSNKWITCNFMAYPRIMIFVAMNDENRIVGFIQWLQKSGFRKESVIELERPESCRKTDDKRFVTLIKDKFKKSR